MEKLELKHIAPYLPYVLNGVDYFQGHKLIRDINCNNVMAIVDGDTKLKPILKPLSDITEEINHNSISIKLEPELDSVIPMLLISKHYHYTIREDGHFSYHIGDGTCIGSLYHSVPYALIQLLLEWHFDVFGLIKKGLAVDINTLDK